MFNLLKSDVKFDKEYTVKEFIEEMMQTRVGDWGCINIYDNAKRIEQLEYDTAGYYVASDNEDHKIKRHMQSVEAQERIIISVLNIKTEAE